MGVRSVDVFRTNRAGTSKTELVTAEVEEVTWVLNGAGGAKISFDPLSADAMLVDLSACELQVWMNESLVNGQCVVPTGVSGNTDKITFEGEGILSYFETAYVATYDPSGIVAPNTPILHWTAQDQFTIVMQLIDWVQSQPNSNRRISSGLVGSTGVYRSRTFYQDSLENVMDALSEFPKLYQGFDFDIVLFDDGRREFWPFYPSKGGFKGQYGLEFDERGRKWVMGVESWKETTVNQTTDVYNTGGTVTDETTDPDTQYKVVGHYENATETGGLLYGRKTKVISSSQINDLGWLNDRAREEQLLLGQPITTATLIVSDDLFGLVKTGDTLPVNVDYGRLRMKGTYRIMQLTWRKDNTMALSLQPVAA